MKEENYEDKEVTAKEMEESDNNRQRGREGK